MKDKIYRNCPLRYCIRNGEGNFFTNCTKKSEEFLYSADEKNKKTIEKSFPMLYNYIVIGKVHKF